VNIVRDRPVSRDAKGTPVAERGIARSDQWIHERPVLLFLPLFYRVVVHVLNRERHILRIQENLPFSSRKAFRWSSAIPHPVGKRMNLFANQLPGCFCFELNDQTFDRNVWSSNRHVGVIRKDSACIHAEVVSANVIRKPATHGASLKTCQLDCRVLERLFCSFALLLIVLIVCEGPTLICCRRGTVSEQLPRSDEVGPGSSWIVG